MAIETFLTNDPADEGEVELDKSLRPTDLANYIGQDRLKKNIKLAITAAKKRGESLEHILLYGPPGLGKTTMATVIANEMGVNITVTSGKAIEKVGDLVSLIMKLKDGDILFIDEIHRLRRPLQETLYSPMEDYKFDFKMGEGLAAEVLKLDLPKFTLIGATTRTALLAAPLRDRFGMIYRLEFYKDEEIESIILRAAKILGVKINDQAAKILAKRARLTTRISNRLLKSARDYADVNGDGFIDKTSSLSALKLLDIDELGLEPADRLLLEAIIDRYKGGPVGVEALSAAIAEENATIEDFYEPYLIQIGLIERTPRGRKATEKAYKHLGRSSQEDAKQGSLL